MSHQFQKEQIVDAFRANGWKMTLGYMLKFPWGYEFRARATELRKKGFTITCERAKNPSDNVYRIIPPDATGQMRLA